jgi:hypothetical protein
MLSLWIAAAAAAVANGGAAGEIEITGAPETLFRIECMEPLGTEAVLAEETHPPQRFTLSKVPLSCKVTLLTGGELEVEVISGTNRQRISTVGADSVMSFTVGRMAL